LRINECSYEARTRRGFAVSAARKNIARVETGARRWAYRARRVTVTICRPIVERALEHTLSRASSNRATRLSFTPSEWARLAGFYGFIALLHVLG
jgi:hypothetical protein